MLKEYRCKTCNKLFFRGSIENATIEIKCKSCKKISTIKGIDCKIWLLSDKNSYYKKSDGSLSKTLGNVKLTCIMCKKKDTCDYYKIIKDEKICPICGGK